LKEGRKPPSDGKENPLPFLRKEGEKAKSPFPWSSVGGGRTPELAEQKKRGGRKKPLPPPRKGGKGKNKNATIKHFFRRCVLLQRGKREDEGKWGGKKRKEGNRPKRIRCGRKGGERKKKQKAIDPGEEPKKRKRPPRCNPPRGKERSREQKKGGGAASSRREPKKEQKKESPNPLQRDSRGGKNLIQVMEERNK